MASAMAYAVMKSTEKSAPPCTSDRRRDPRNSGSTMPSVTMVIAGSAFAEATVRTAIQSRRGSGATGLEHRAWPRWALRANNRAVG